MSRLFPVRKTAACVLLSGISFCVHYYLHDMDHLRSMMCMYRWIFDTEICSSRNFSWLVRATLKHKSMLKYCCFVFSEMRIKSEIIVECKDWNLISTMTRFPKWNHVVIKLIFSFNLRMSYNDWRSVCINFSIISLKNKI